MKMSKVVLFACAGLCLFSFTTFAQDDGTSDTSIEELYLSNPALRAAYDASRSDDRESKLLAISQLSELIDEGMNTRDEEQATEILKDLAGQGTTVIVREKGRLVNYYMDVRRDACRVLATVKTTEAKRKAIKVLIGVMNVDDDPIVKSAAAYAIGVIGLNENEESAKAIARALDLQDKVLPNDHFAYSSLLALEKIAKANNGIFNAETSRVLVKIVQGNYNRTVKDRALAVLQLLKTYSR